MHSGVAALS